jgi:transposase
VSKVTLITVDLAKDVFQVAGFNRELKNSFNKRLKRSEIAEFMSQQPPCELVMEACYSSHYWGRRFQEMEHTVRLLPAQHVTPFVRGNKSDRNDTIAIAEASRRPNIVDVPLKSVAQQDIQCLHRMRDSCVSRRNAVTNQARGLLAEYGIVEAGGHGAFLRLLSKVTDPEASAISPVLKIQFQAIRDEYLAINDRINDILKELTRIANQEPICKLLLTIPGIGVINATAIYSAIGNGSQFRSAREFAVWLGLTPKQRSSGNTFVSSGITKRGDRYLRKQLVHGARSLLYRCPKKTDRLSTWVNQLVARRGAQKACVALAARLARLCWILIQKQEPYRVVAS